VRLDVRRVPPRHRPALLLAVVLLALVLDWLHIAGPRCASLGDMRTHLAARGVELAAARREAASRDDTTRAVREAARALRRAETRLPNRRELAALLAAVARSAREARLELLLLRPKPERRADDHAEVPLEIRGRGTYLEALSFLRRVERLGRLVHIADLRLERPERAGERVVLRLSCTASTYRFLGSADRRTAGTAPGGDRG
jgi:type IV pilus assembly protein PilO